jgi:hypothetical protein
MPQWTQPKQNGESLEKLKKWMLLAMKEAAEK